ncbi:MAG: HupE/UreJ family protein [Gammaproteobacteria bacterium]|nr:HupE/UreJ family protein [Gammaproteobacteria bacterium]
MRSIALLLLSGLFATAALAHHPLGGMPMETFTHGILSGVGHPLLGFDHLFFIAAVGIAAIYTRSRTGAPLAYIAAMLAGCLLSSLWSTALASELMIALSLLVLGSMLLSGRRFGDNTIRLGFAGFGLFHGAAFGVSIAVQEAAIGIEVLIGYLLGLGITQYAIAIAVGSIFIALWKTAQPAAMQTRLAGAMVAGAGLFLTLEQVEGPLISLISS